MGKKKVIEEIKWNALNTLSFIVIAILLDFLLPQINIFNDDIFIQQAIGLGILTLIANSAVWGIIEYIKN